MYHLATMYNITETQMTASCNVHQLWLCPEQFYYISKW